MAKVKAIATGDRFKLLVQYGNVHAGTLGKVEDVYPASENAIHALFFGESNEDEGTVRLKLPLSAIERI